MIRTVVGMVLKLWQQATIRLFLKKYLLYYYDAQVIKYYKEK